MDEAFYDACYGDPDEDDRGIPVPSDLADLFAEAHERVHGGKVGVVERGTVRAARTRRTRPPVSPASPAEAADVLRVARAPIVLAGPGVVQQDAVEPLRTFAAAGSLGVLNTWGAKGVFNWESPHHLATVGLQAADFALAGVHDADLVVAVGVDEREAPPGRWRRGHSVTMRPDDLDELADRWRRPSREIKVPELRIRLAAVTERGWEVATGRVWPSGVTRAYAGVLDPGGLVAADPGIAGFWVARTVPTRRPRTVIVPPAADRPGLAVACAIVARLREPGRPVLAVVDAPVHPRVHAILHVAADLGVAVGLEVWDPDAPTVTRDEHADRVAAVATAPSSAVVSVAPDPAQLQHIIDAAGPVVAWRDLNRPAP